jgi:cytochrome c553
MKASGLLLLFGLSASSACFGDVVKMDLPVETSEFRAGPNKEVAMTYCVLCHSWDYVTMQPALPRTTWKAVVTKMRGTFGAPLTDAQIEDIADYLVRAYGGEPTAENAAGRPAHQRGTGDKDPAR